MYGFIFKEEKYKTQNSYCLENLGEIMWFAVTLSAAQNVLLKKSGNC